MDNKWHHETSVQAFINVVIDAPPLFSLMRELMDTLAQYDVQWISALATKSLVSYFSTLHSPQRIADIWITSPGASVRKAKTSCKTQSLGFCVTDSAANPCTTINRGEIIWDSRFFHCRTKDVADGMRSQRAATDKPIHCVLQDPTDVPLLPQNAKCVSSKRPPNFGTVTVSI